MGDKSLRKKQYIVEKARGVFMEKGYKNVTMKDIVEACDISRGGLYLYFDSTKQLFLEVLKAEGEGEEDVFAGKVSETSGAAEILVLFLVDQKKAILKKKSSLAKATYEFYFETRLERKDDIIKNEFDAEVKVLEAIIDKGIKLGEFVCSDSLEAARNIMFTLEGLKIMSNTVGLSADILDKQFLYILSTLGVNSEA